MKVKVKMLPEGSKIPGKLMYSGKKRKFGLYFYRSEIYTGKQWAYLVAAMCLVYRFPANLSADIGRALEMGNLFLTVCDQEQFITDVKEEGSKKI